MTENNSIAELIDEFQQYFPDINLHGKSTHGGIESMLREHVAEFTLEQWKAITDTKYNSLFEDGIPHISWNTERNSIANRMLKQDAYSTCFYEDTWYSVSEYYFKIEDKFLKIVIEQSRVNYDSHAHISVVDEAPEPNTHTAVLMDVSRTGKVFIVDQLTGSLSRCEDWIASEIKKREVKTFKIIEL